MADDSGLVTTGFQPLWGFMLAFMYSLLGGREITVAQYLGAIFGVLTGLLLFVAVKKIAKNNDVAFLALVSFYFSPQVIKHNINGMETSLAMMGVIGLFLFFVSAQHCTWMKNHKAMFLFGVISGVAVMARVDSLLLVLSILGLLYAEQQRCVATLKETRRFALLSSFALFGTGLGLAILPWGIFCTSLGYDWLPESGGAVRQISLVGRLPLVSLKDSILEYGNLYLPYHLENMLDFTAGWIRQVPVLLVASIPVYALRFDNAQAVICIIAILSVIFLWIFMPSNSLLSRTLLVWCLWVALMTSAYSFVVLGQWFYDRYASAIAVIFNALILIFLSKWLFGRLKGWLHGIIVVELMLVFVVLLWGGSYRWLIYGPSVVPDDGFYRTAEYLNKNLDEGNRVGVFQSGLIGYYAKAQVINLDGKVNREARAAIQTGRMFEYICKSGIEYLADWETQIDQMLIQRSMYWRDDNLVLQKRIEVPLGHDLVIYSVNRDNCR